MIINSHVTTVHFSQSFRIVFCDLHSRINLNTLLDNPPPPIADKRRRWRSSTTPRWHRGGESFPTDILIIPTRTCPLRMVNTEQNFPAWMFCLLIYRVRVKCGPVQSRRAEPKGSNRSHFKPAVTAFRLRQAALRRLPDGVASGGGRVYPSCYFVTSHLNVSFCLAV